MRSRGCEEYEFSLAFIQTVAILMLMNETQLKVAARKIARQATRLRKQGRHDEADAMVKQAAANVDAMRAAGRVVA